MICKIQSGHEIQVDRDDLDLVHAHKWYGIRRPLKKGEKQYARSSVRTETGSRIIYLHRLILGAEKGQVVDHINGDSMDNRRSNLRFASPSLNAVNKNTVGGVSGYRGVQRNNRGKKWRARLYVDQKALILGSYETPEEAALAYNEAALAAFGEFARLNEVPKQGPEE
jgi:hypothetical protein